MIDENNLSLGKGSRNSEVFRYACSLQTRGFSDGEIKTRCGEIAKQCVPPLSVREVDNIVRSALKYPKGKPFEPKTRQKKNSAKAAPKAAAPLDFSEQYKLWQADINGASVYIKSRGLSLETVKAHNCGYDRARNMLIFPYGSGFYNSRFCGGKKLFRKPKGGCSELYNAAALSQSKPVFVTESEFDALSIAEAGGAAVALGGCGNTRVLLDFVSEKPPCAPLLLALDNDGAGQKSTAELAAALEQLGLKFYCVTDIVCGENKDANESLCADRERFVENVSRAAEIEPIKAESAAAIQKLRAEFPECFAAADEKTAPPFVFESKSGLDIDEFSLCNYIIEKYHVHALCNAAAPLGANPLFVLYDEMHGKFTKIDKFALQGKVSEIIKAAGIDGNRILPRAKHTLELIISNAPRLEPDALNADESIINFADGLLDLNTMEIFPHTPMCFSTIQLPARWGEVRAAGDCPIFNAFLAHLADNDEKCIEVLWEFLGLAISNSEGYKAKSALFLLGENDCGKSVFLNFLAWVLGRESTANIDLAALERDKFSTYSLYGVRLGYNDDMQNAQINSTAVFKSLCGGGAIAFEGKYLNKFSAVYRGVLAFAMNSLPEFSGNEDTALFSRMLIIRCGKTIPPEMRDRELIQKFKTERNAVIKKAVESFQKLKARNFLFDVAAKSELEREILKMNCSAVRQFLSECCVEFDGDAGREIFTPCKQVFERFIEFCKATNTDFRGISSHKFNRELSTIFGVPNNELYKNYSGNVRAYRFFDILPP